MGKGSGNGSLKYKHKSQQISLKTEAKKVHRVILGSERKDLNCGKVRKVGSCEELESVASDYCRAVSLKAEREHLDASFV